MVQLRSYRGDEDKLSGEPKFEYVDRSKSGAMIRSPKEDRSNLAQNPEETGLSSLPDVKKENIVFDALETEPEGKGSLAAVILPLALSVLILTLCFFFVGDEEAVELFGLSILTATVLGKFAVLRGLNESGLFDSPYRVAFLIIYLDLMIGTIAVFNIRVLYLLPKFGDKIKGLQNSGVQILERNPWMRKATFAGVVAFVMFPLSGTGAIGGSLFGRLLGMSRIVTLIGIGVGSVLGSFGMAALAAAFGTQLAWLQSSGILGYGGIVFVGLAIYWLYRRSKRPNVSGS